MSHQLGRKFFSHELLHEGAIKMAQMIQRCQKTIIDNPQKLVFPQIKPGFLRKELPSQAPQEGENLDVIYEKTQKIIFPGMANWQSPKFFGYYPSQINVTNIFAQMFVTANHSPGFNFASSPSHTQLQNIMMDWAAKFLQLPDKFELKNSGGGIINNSASQSIFASAHAAKFKKIKQLNIQLNNPDVLKLVGYYGQMAHASSQRALMIKDIYYRKPIPYKYNDKIKNYQIQIQKMKQIIQEDIKNGLIPFWFGTSYGNTLSQAIDINQQVVSICKKYKIWINVDAAFLGSTWISPKFRPKTNILEHVDSIAINFSKILLSGTGGSLLYVSDKKIFTQAFGAKNTSFAFYKNEYTGNQDIVDYKDWIVGLGRRNNSLKLYYTFSYYGLKPLRQGVELMSQKTHYLQKLIQANSQYFEIHTIGFAVLMFQIKDKNGVGSSKLTEQVLKDVKNCKQGFSSPGDYKGTKFIRICVGNWHTQKKHLENYLQLIIQKAKIIRELA